MDAAVRSPYDHLVRSLVRAEADTVELAARTTARIGDVPPARALRAVAAHALSTRERLARVLAGHGVAAMPARRRMSELCRWVIARLVDPERLYGDALDELRRELDVVYELRSAARVDGLFGLIRWCDDWLPARRAHGARRSAAGVVRVARHRPAVRSAPARAAAHRRGRDLAVVPRSPVMHAGTRLASLTIGHDRERSQTGSIAKTRSRDARTHDGEVTESLALDRAHPTFRCCSK